MPSLGSPALLLPVVGSLAPHRCRTRTVQDLPTWLRFGRWLFYCGFELCLLRLAVCAGDGGIWLCGRTASSLSLPSVTPRGVYLRFRNASYKSVWPCPPSGRLSSSRNAELSLAPRGVVRGGDRRAALQLPFGVCPSRLAAASPGQRHRPFPGRGLRQAVGALLMRVKCGVDGQVLPRSTRHPLPPPVSWASPGWCPVSRVPCGAWLGVQGAATGRAPHPTLTRAWSGRDETLPCLRDPPRRPSSTRGVCEGRAGPEAAGGDRVRQPGTEPRGRAARDPARSGPQRVVCIQTLPKPPLHSSPGQGFGTWGGRQSPLAGGGGGARGRGSEGGSGVCPSL